MRATASIGLVCLLLGGCSGLINDYEFTPAAPQAFSEPAEPPVNPSPGAIYQADNHLNLFEDRTARHKGDLLTIRLVERTNASKTASTSTDKANEISLENPILFGQPFSIGSTTLETEVRGERAYTGSGDSDQSNSLSGQVSAVVVNVYPNGYLHVRGEKKLTLNQGAEFIQISGMVRLEDIAPDNSVLSTQVADAEITYAGTGALADANAAGWLYRFFLSPLWPF